MTFVDSNVFIYAVGRPHPLRDDAQQFYLSSRAERKRLVTSAEVLQELLHVYLPVGRFETLDAALEPATGCMDEIIPVDAASVLHARCLAAVHPQLTARDLLHLSVCQLKHISHIQTFAKGLPGHYAQHDGARNAGL